MTETDPLVQPLPALRAELQHSDGIVEATGVKTHVLFDPLRHRYFQIDSKNLAMLTHWNSDSLGALLDRCSYAGVTLADAQSLIRFLYTNSLTVEPAAGDSSQYFRQLQQSKRSFFQRAIHQYLFFRVPLFRPHSFLKNTLKFTELFFSRTWWALMGVVALLGLYLTSRQWDEFTNTFVHSLSADGLLSFAVALFCIKCAHELGHAYAATRYGCRVTVMGVAFLVMFPVLYTDTTDSWKLTSRRQRLVITGAGVGVELTVAAITTMLWVFLPESNLRDAAFFLATSSWLISIAVNLNPLMRFDGYHFLSDLIPIQNLQQRSFALGKWRLREVLFAPGEPAPEAMSSRLRRSLVLFAWATWVYRFFLFLGIAWLIHTMVFKPLGTVLAVIELAFFILVPVMKEFKQWWGLRSTPLRTAATCRTVIVSVFLISLFVLPWQTTIRIPAVLEAAEVSPLYAPRPATVASIAVSQGEKVVKGQTILTLHAPHLEHEILSASRRLELVQARLSRIASDARDKTLKPVLEQQQQQLKEILTGYQKEQQRLTVKAPISGIVSNLEDSLHPGRWVNESLSLASVSSVDSARVRGLVTQDSLPRLQQTSKAVFVPDIPEIPAVSGTIALTSGASIETVNIPELASAYGGPVRVSSNTETLRPLSAWYPLRMSVAEHNGYPDQVITGQLLAQGKAESFLSRAWRRTVSVILRETG